jgi:hypothetical protein
VQVEHPLIKPSSERIEIDKQKWAKAEVAKKYCPYETSHRTPTHRGIHDMCSIPIDGGAYWQKPGCNLCTQHHSQSTAYTEKTSYSFLHLQCPSTQIGATLTKKNRNTHVQKGTDVAHHMIELILNFLIDSLKWCSYLHILSWTHSF